MSKVKRQKLAIAEQARGANGEVERNLVRYEVRCPQSEIKDTGAALLEAMLTRVNLQRAWNEARQ